MPKGRTIRKLMGVGGGGAGEAQKTRENKMKKKFTHAN